MICAETPDFSAVADSVIHLLAENGFSSEQAAMLLTLTTAKICTQAELDANEFVKHFYKMFTILGGKVEFSE